MNDGEQGEHGEHEQEAAEREHEGSGQPEPSEAVSGPEEPADELARVRAEAASRRRQLRDVEAERDQLRERVDAADRAEVERRAEAARFHVPADVWSVTSLEDLRGGDGRIDAEKVGQVLVNVRSERPHWIRHEGPSPHQGARPPVRERGPSFGDALKGARRGAA